MPNTPVPDTPVPNALQTSGSGADGRIFASDSIAIPSGLPSFLTDQNLSGEGTFGVRFAEINFGADFSRSYTLVDDTQTVTFVDGMAAVPLPAGFALMLGRLGIVARRRG